MYPVRTPLLPLPAVLRQPRPDRAGRRRRIGDHDIDPDGLRHFNELLGYLPGDLAPLDRDQLASAARELIDGARSPGPPRCIVQRMRRAMAIHLMVDDPDWSTLDEPAISAMVTVVAYRHAGRALIPSSLPVVGHLDDAIVVEAAWPSLAAEVRQYLAFCRIRQVEAGLRGESGRHFGFSRRQWQAAARAESAWIAHCARVGQSSYLTGRPAAPFRVN